MTATTPLDQAINLARIYDLQDELDDLKVELEEVRSERDGYARQVDAKRDEILRLTERADELTAERNRLGDLLSDWETAIRRMLAQL